MDDRARSAVEGTPNGLGRAPSDLCALSCSRPGAGPANECTATRVQYAAARAEKLDPNISPVEKAIAHDRDLLIINPDSFPLGPDGHREPVARPA